MGIRSTVIAGIKWSIVEKILVAVMNLAQLMIVARFVSKSDIGLMAMISTTLAFFNILSDMGMGNSVLHYQENRPPGLIALFWIYSALGILLACVCFVSTPVIIYFFQEPRLELVIKLASISLALNGLGILHRTLLYKAMLFRSLSIIRILTTTFSFVVTITLVVYGWGVYALVVGLLLGNILNTFFFLYRGYAHLPLHLTPDFSMLKKHFRFGAYQTAERLMTTISTQFDTLIIGRLLGAEILGVYDIIKRLLARPMRVINPIFTTISTPILASNKGAMKELYLRQILYLCSTSFPVYAFLLFANEMVIQIVLSASYLSPISGTIFSLFCVYFMIYTVQNPIGTLIIASGAVKRSFLYNSGIALSLPIILYFAVYSGLSIVVTCMVVFQACMVILAQQYLLKPAANIQMGAFLGRILLPTGISLVAFGAGHMISSFFYSSWMAIIISGLTGGALYLLLSWFLNKQYIAELIQLTNEASH